MLKKWMNRKDGKEMSLRERILRVILIFCIAITALSSAIGPLMGLSGTVILVMVAVLIMASFSLWLIMKHQKIDMASDMMTVCVNIGLLPVIFFYTGGLAGGAALWFVFGIVSVYLLFSGRKCFYFTILTMISFLVTLCLAYMHPEWIKQISNGESYINSGLAIFVVGTAIGMFIRFQKEGYDRECKIAEQRSRELENMSRSQSTFFANMSHEIRTPINTIIGLNEMILREDISDEIAENAINIQNASKMLLVLINDILDLSKLESGKMEIVPVQYETGAMFSDLVNIIWIRAHDKGLEFKIDISEEIPSMLYGDEVRLKQVLTNILTNAVKYTEKGSVTLSAKSERISNNKVLLRISVEDTGMGIKKENLKDLFSSFKRVDEEKNRNIEGTGLGLSISKQLIEMMGGEIAVDSIYTRGSTFTVTVEQEIVNADPVGTVNFMVKRKIYNRDRYKQSFEAPEARVLIVDDNEMNLMVASKLLRSTKVQIDTAKSGKECLEKTKTKAYHVIFMDHMMPEMDGEETLHKLRTQENGHCQNVPVIALTANVMTGAEQIYRDKGFEGYLAKPINGALFEMTLFKYIPQELVEYSVEESEQEKTDTTIKMISQRGKKQIGITTDCVCDLPEEFLEYFDIKTMYCYVHTKEGRFCDGKEINSENLLRYLENEENTTSSSAAEVHEYEDFLAGALDEAEKVIHISVASRTGDEYRIAMQASKGFDNVTVVDSGHLSSGLGMMVLYAAKIAQEGCSVEEIVERLVKLKERVVTSFIVPSPNSLYRNGRIGKNVRNICDTLSLRPILYLNQSRIKIRGVVVGNVEGAYKKYIHQQLRNRSKIDKRMLFIINAGCTVKQLEQIQNEVEKYVQFEKVVFQKASATISSNCGLGAFGLIFMRKKK